MSNMITANFSRAECACHCGCGNDLVSLELITKLQAARDEYKKPIILNCVARCPKHNSEVGGAEDSAHLSTDKKVGQAADLACTDSHERYVLFKILIKYFTRLELGDVWIHVDVARDDAHPGEVIFVPKYAQRK